MPDKCPKCGELVSAGSIFMCRSSMELTEFVQSLTCRRICELRDENQVLKAELHELRNVCNKTKQDLEALHIALHDYSKDFYVTTAKFTNTLAKTQG